MSLAPYVRILGRGPGRSRALTGDEARAAMELILSDRAAPEAIGALLMLMRYRGESAPEIAGFTQALQSGLGDWAQVPAALDWPSYAAGRSRGAPLFLLSAKLVAQAGIPVLVHGWNSGAASVRAALPGLGIPQVASPDAAAGALAAGGIAYVPAEVLHAPALDLLKLRDVLGLRSCLNTVFRMLNPAGAPAMVQGVFHPSYGDLQSDAAALLGQPSLGVIKGGGGEFERHPGKQVMLHGLRAGGQFEAGATPLTDDTRRLYEPDLPPISPADLLSGAVQDPFAEACVTGTAALALFTCGGARTLTDAEDLARQLWRDRDRAQAA